MNKRQKKALYHANYDLFTTPPPPVMPQVPGYPAGVETESGLIPRPKLPSEAGLREMFDRFNDLYFEGQLPRVKIEYSDRMLAAGMYLPSAKIIRIGRRYHNLYPEELADTLKHEMIHIIHIKHDAAFKAEARRIGASIRARSHPDLRRPPKYVYECPVCGREYPRQKRLRMASCGVCTSGRKFDKRFKLRLKYSVIRPN
ncbi:MAG TPA: SprT-like domain-containing protein [candidate division Zixibacteria bacterium]|nr:SprT-like domain-containing protein [candidate division Zixibacteria bacterium]